MMEHSPEKLKVQYATTKNLDASFDMLERFIRHLTRLQRWVFDQYDFEPGMRILELGCGAAHQWRDGNRDRIDPEWHITLTDHSLGMLSTAREATSDLGFTYANVNAMVLPYPDHTFDRVIATHMLYHVPDRPAAFSEIVRVLRPVGKLFAGT